MHCSAVKVHVFGFCFIFLGESPSDIWNTHKDKIEYTDISKKGLVEQKGQVTAKQGWRSAAWQAEW